MEPWLERAARSHPDVTAIDTPDGSLTYAELLERARGVRITAPTVAIALPSGLDFVIALHACLLCGVAAVPVDLREPVWRMAGAGQMIEGLENGGQLRRPGPSLVVHTSGTTGEPRPVRLSAGNIDANARAVLSVVPAGRW